MELRRALLLFAIVLGLAAIASSIARPPERGGDDRATDRADSMTDGGATTTPSATATSRGSPRHTTIEFRDPAKPQTLKIEVDQPATVLVDVEAPGQVEIPSLGLTASADPLTPATFEILATEAGSHGIVVQPAAAGARPAKVGTLRVVPAS